MIKECPDDTPLIARDTFYYYYLSDEIYSLVRYFSLLLAKCFSTLFGNISKGTVGNSLRQIPEGLKYLDYVPMVDADNYDMGASRIASTIISNPIVLLECEHELALLSGNDKHDTESSDCLDLARSSLPGIHNILVSWKKIQKGIC